MKLLQDTFRIWWQKPSSVTEREKNREISYLELFYDLVYVAIVIELTHILAGNISLGVLIQYIALFSMVWWAWLNGSLYHELHGNNDVRTRIFTFIQMLSLAGMGIFTHNAFGAGYQGFAISYALFLSILTYLWWRTGVYDRDHKPFSTPYVWGFSFTTILFVISIFTIPTVSFYLWGIAIVFSLFLPFTLNRRTQLKGTTHTKSSLIEHREAALSINPSFVERLGLLTIIILGEAVISAVQGATFIETLRMSDIVHIMGFFGIIFSMWWIYFDFIARRLPVQGTINRFIWIYLHLFLTLSIGLLSVGVYNTLKYAEYLQGANKWILIAPLMLFLFTIILLIQTLDIRKELKRFYGFGTIASAVSIVLLGIIGVIDFGTTITIISAMFVIFIPVVAGFFVWIDHASTKINTQ
ncbi:low temperature requirement protein A [Candidatus Gracilibacteria bacterium]|nr:low temperature requirement protein A [Candidatus Gracilibacteria bacterium]